MTEPPVEPRPVQEEDLHAYVDGRLDPERREEVARRLAGDASLQRRVADWQRQRTLLRDVLAFRQREPVPPSLTLSSLAEARLAALPSPTRWRFAAGLALALTIGAAGGWMAHGPPNPSEIARLSLEAASAYQVFANDSAQPVEPGADNPVALTSLMARKLGRPVAVPDLSGAGYHLLGGRLLAVMYGPAAMLVYEDARHNRISVYIQPMRRGEETPMRAMDGDEVGGYAWINGKVGYSVMSEGDRARLHSIANQVRDGAVL